MVTGSILAESIKAEAKRLGFFACGIAKAEPVDEVTSHHFRQWLREGHQAGMSYMANHQDMRLDPRLLMEGTESIICVALNYAPAKRIPDDEYQIAAYAYGQDYHDIVKDKLHQLATFIANREETLAYLVSGENGLTPSAFAYRAFSDSAPVLERYWAVKAGLGWIGKNRQLIVPKAGSMFFLGELFVNIALPYDKPQENRCGQCQRCLEACPTGALSANDSASAFDANLCLSYQTIENRSTIPETIVRKMGNSIYGCDRCQQACPWNAFAHPTDEPALQPKDELLQMTKAKWQTITEDEYRRLFKGSAVKRAKYSGLMRNIKAVSENEQEGNNDQVREEPGKPERTVEQF